MQQQQYYFELLLIVFQNIGYSSNAKSGKAERAIKKDGANVIIWSFFHLYDDDGTKKIKTSLDLNEIRNIREKYENEM